MLYQNKMKNQYPVAAALTDALSLMDRTLRGEVHPARYRCLSTWAKWVKEEKDGGKKGGRGRGNAWWFVLALWTTTFLLWNERYSNRYESFSLNFMNLTHWQTQNVPCRNEREPVFQSEWATNRAKKRQKLALLASVPSRNLVHVTSKGA